jgi:GxxExxY protein
MVQPPDQPPSTPSTPRIVWDAEALASAVIGAAIRVHRVLGPGLLESAYEACLVHEITNLEIPTRRQVALPIRYDSVTLDVGYRLDVLVDDQLIVEVKSVDRLDRVHMAQMLTYLRLSGRRVGLLINFNTALLKNGLRRVVNQYDDPTKAKNPNLGVLGVLGG